LRRLDSFFFGLVALPRMAAAALSLFLYFFLALAFIIYNLTIVANASINLKTWNGQTNSQNMIGETKLRKETNKLRGKLKAKGMLIIVFHNDTLEYAYKFPPHQVPANFLDNVVKVGEMIIEGFDTDENAVNN
jgi:hypothetical protein